MKPIRKAATVLVVRDGGDDVEVFMVQRPARGDFPDLHVFPGGKVDDHDRSLNTACHGLDDAEASRRLNVDEGGLAYWITAIRECFEEAGVLLAYRAGHLFAPEGDDEHRRFEQYRGELIAGNHVFSGLVEEEGIVLAADHVHYFSHWITPEGAPVRFDTRFFLAEMPPSQAADAHAWETVSGTWVTPKEALARQGRGEWQMIHPTIITLSMLSGFNRVDSLVRAVSTREHEIEVTQELHRQGMQFPSPRA